MKRYLSLLLFLAIISSCDITSSKEQEFDLFDDNISFETAEYITLNKWFHSALFPSGDEDYYRFSLENASILLIDADSISEPLQNQKIELYNSDSLLLETMELDSTDLRMAKKLPAGDYYLHVSTDDSLYTDDSLRIVVWVSQLDTLEINDSMSQASEVTLNSMGQNICRIYPKYDLDYFTFTIDTPQTVAIPCSGVPETYKLNISIFESDGTEVQRTNVSSSSSQKRADFVLPTAGQYYLRFDSQWGIDDEKFFSFWVMSADSLSWTTLE